MFAVTLIPILCVAFGGAIGALLRYAVIQLTMQLHPQPFPLGTMLVNIAGSFLIGLLMARYLSFDSQNSQLFFVTGVLGGFTTFSAFSWDALQLIQRGEMGSALLYVVGSVLLSFAAVAGGYQMGR
ncbi:MAG: fluoride efflux transporter CrcB [Rickettsiales bacterium]